MLGGNVFGAALGGHIGTRASELLDGRMTAEEEHRARLHLGCCRQCAIMVGAEQEARDVLRSMAMPTSLTPPRELVAGLMAISGPPMLPPGAAEVTTAAIPAPVPPAALVSGPAPLASTVAVPAPARTSVPVSSTPPLSPGALATPAGPPGLTQWYRSPRLKGALAVSSLLAAGVTAAVTITSPTAPAIQRQAGSVARSNTSSHSVTGPRAYSQASFTVEQVNQATLGSATAIDAGR